MSLSLALHLAWVHQAFSPPVHAQVHTAGRLDNPTRRHWQLWRLAQELKQLVARSRFPGESPPPPQPPPRPGGLGGAAGRNRVGHRDREMLGTGGVAGSLKQGQLLS